MQLLAETCWTAFLRRSQGPVPPLRGRRLPVTSDSLQSSVHWGVTGLRLRWAHAWGRPFPAPGELGSGTNKRAKDKKREEPLCSGLQWLGRLTPTVATPILGMTCVPPCAWRASTLPLAHLTGPAVQALPQRPGEAVDMKCCGPACPAASPLMTRQVITAVSQSGDTQHNRMTAPQTQVHARQGSRSKGGTSGFAQGRINAEGARARGRTLC